MPESSPDLQIFPNEFRYGRARVAILCLLPSKDVRDGRGKPFRLFKGMGIAETKGRWLNRFEKQPAFPNVEALSILAEA
jgi:hypothetical protein